MADGKAVLERMIGGPVELFAYPNGIPGEDFGPRHVALARKVGFRRQSPPLGARLDERPTYSSCHASPRGIVIPWKFNARLLLNTRRSAVEI